MKQEFVTHLSNLLNDKLQYRQKAIKLAEDDKNSDTKSSAGDKHETSRAMAQLEIDKLQAQLAVQANDSEQLQRIDSTTKHTVIGFGSWVQTNKNIFFIAVPFGKVLFENQSVFCISLASPIGQLLKGKSKGDSITFNGVIQLIQFLE